MNTTVNSILPYQNPDGFQSLRENFERKLNLSILNFPSFARIMKRNFIDSNPTQNTESHTRKRKIYIIIGSEEQVEMLIKSTLNPVLISKNVQISATEL